MWICQPPGQSTISVVMVLMIKHILLFDSGCAANWIECDATQPLF